MRQRHTAAKGITNRRRASSASGLTFRQFSTALGIGVVLILLGATFLGDYLSVPTLSVSALPGVISPNGDKTQDFTNLSYTLSEEADVLIEVLNPAGRAIKTLSEVKKQPAGQYVVSWDGSTDAGQAATDGLYRLQVTAKGASRAVSQSAEVRIDTQPPPLKLTNLDEITRLSSPALTIEGLTEAGATVLQAGIADPVTVDNQGRFTIERQLPEGATILEILASDQAGNTTRVSHEVTLITKPPEVTLTAPNNDQWTNEGVIEVSGIAPGAAEVTVNNQPVTLLDNGAFNYELILQEGDNAIRVEVTDEVGNVSIQERLVHLKTKAPSLSLNIEDGATFQQSTIQLTGRTDPGATVLVNNQVVAVSALGEFQLPLHLMNGANVINVETRDIAGNIATLSKQVSFESPVAQNELDRFLNNLPQLPSLGTPLLILIPSLLLLGYLFSRPVSLMLYSDSENFTPGLPDEGQQLTLTLDLSKSARTTVEVLNRFNRPVATISYRRQRESGQHTFFWDGYDDFGNVLPAGEYTIKASASTPGGSVSSAIPLFIHEDPLVHGQYARRKDVGRQKAVLRQ